MKRWMMKAGVSVIDDLVFEEAPMPEPARGEVRVRVHAVSLNARDLMVLEQGFMRLPGVDLVPASDMSGTIDAVGEGVQEWRIGDHVVNLHFKGWTDGAPPADAGGGLGSLDEDGVLSSYVVLSAERLARAPEGYGHAEAACLPCAAVTAWNGVMDRNPIGPGDTLLILGTGGVALFGLMIARQAGAEVAAVVRREDHLDRLRGMGVDTIIRSDEVDDWGPAILERTGGVAKVLDTTGFATVNQSLAACGYGGEVALVGLREGEAAPLDFGLFGKSVRGVTVGSAAMYRALREEIAQTGARPVIARRFPFDAADQALRALGERGQFGKIVIDVS